MWLIRRCLVLIVSVAGLLAGSSLGPASAELFFNDTGISRQWPLKAGPGGIRAARAWDQEWQFVAKEGGHGFVVGSRLARLGDPDPAVNAWVYKEVTGDFDCTTSFFGKDPRVDVEKQCQVAVNWRTLAHENQSFDLAGRTARVRYGYGDRWVSMIVTNRGSCSSEFFKRDPWYLTVKICQEQVLPDGEGVIAEEGEGFWLSEESVVGFGTANNFVYKRLSGGTHQCTAHTFADQDPARNWYKHCRTVGTMGQGVWIASVDTGVTAHPDLDANVDYGNGWDFVDGDRDAHDPGSRSCLRPASWHGTMMASVAAGVGNNSLGYTGIAPFARILPLRIVSCVPLNSSVAEIESTNDRMIRAIRYAAGISSPTGSFPSTFRPARVIAITVAMAYEECPAALARAIAEARARGSLVVAAVPNAGTSMTPGRASPANCPFVLPVGGSTREGTFWTGSTQGDQVQVSAPAVDIPVLTNLGTMDPAGDGATSASGTSAATMEVAAAAAVMWGINPKLTPSNVANRLGSTARPYASSCSGCGRGIVDVHRAALSARAITTSSGRGFNAAHADPITAPADIVSPFRSGVFDYYSVNLPPGSTLRVYSAVGERPTPSDQWRCLVQVPGVPGLLSCSFATARYTNDTLVTKQVAISVDGGSVMQKQTYGMVVDWNDGDV